MNKEELIEEKDENQINNLIKELNERELIIKKLEKEKENLFKQIRNLKQEYLKEKRETKQKEEKELDELLSRINSARPPGEELILTKSEPPKPPYEFLREQFLLHLQLEGRLYKRIVFQLGEKPDPFHSRIEEKLTELEAEIFSETEPPKPLRKINEEAYRAIVQYDNRKRERDRIKQREIEELKQIIENLKQVEQITNTRHIT